MSTRPLPKQYDSLIVAIADYVCSTPSFSEEAYQVAILSLADAIGCAILSLKFPACTKLLGPLVPGTVVPHGARIIGTSFKLDPINAAFDLGCMIRWLDYNDTWLAAEWAHPSDNLGGILPLMDHLNQCTSSTESKFSVLDLLNAMIQAYEIQGVLALSNSFNRVGFDHVILVKIATTAVATRLLGGTHEQIMSALSNAWIDVGPLRTYRHAPNTGSRKSWAAGDATSRGVFFAYMAMKGEQGYLTALSEKTWGLQNVLFDGKPLELSRPLGCYVMENILFKVAFPAEFHAQTAVEAALKLYPQTKQRIEEIGLIEIETHQSALRIIDKTGPLNNPADRDHCLQYMVAVALLYGTLLPEYYEDDIASDPRIDALREKMRVRENPQYTRDYLDPQKRYIANSLKIHFKNGDILGPLYIPAPLGHRERRKESLPLLFLKCKENLAARYSSEKVDQLLELFKNSDELLKLPVDKFVDLF